MASLLTTLMCMHTAHAQRYRYIDSSGGIHFVDSLKGIPREYREQVVPATPTPVLDARAKQQLRFQQENQMRMQQRQQEMKRRELERQRVQLEQMQGGRGVVKPPQRGGATSSAGEIEVIQ